MQYINSSAIYYKLCLALYTEELEGGPDTYSLQVHINKYFHELPFQSRKFIFSESEYGQVRWRLGFLHLKECNYAFLIGYFVTSMPPFFIEKNTGSATDNDKFFILLTVFEVLKSN